MTQTSAENGERLRLLVVDATTGLEKLLREAVGADVEIVTRGAMSSARRALLERPIDCVVLDIPAPGGQGLEKLEAILSSASDVPVVVQTRSDVPPVVQTKAEDQVPVTVPQTIPVTVPPAAESPPAPGELPSVPPITPATVPPAASLAAPTGN